MPVPPANEVAQPDAHDLPQEGRALPDIDRKMKFARWSTIGVLVGSALLCGYGYYSGAFRSVEELRTVVEGFGVFGPIIFIALQAVQVVFPVLPAGIGLVAGPVLFGPVLGTLYNYLGICIGSVYVFHLARMYGTPLLKRMFSEKMFARYEKWANHPKAAFWFAIAILLPVAPDDYLCYLAGTTSMKARTYWLIIWLLKPWALIVYTFGLIWILNLIPGVNLS
ncbi:TVP38/TMEM64 family protein [Dermabacteraceae bacterium CCM 9520]